MYIVDGIAYAGEKEPVIKISGVRPMEDYKLWLRFSTGETKIFDFKPLLEKPAFAPLTDKTVFNFSKILFGNFRAKIILLLNFTQDSLRGNT